tara:strand:- start:664 stop:1260 length:597 start_codon:yes stop_codon:yes gene_type:complete
MIKIILRYLSIVLFFSFYSWTKAEDIKDFQIEGMSIGESLLEHKTENEIISSKINYFKGNRRYYVVRFDRNLKKYEAVEVYLKTGDKKYIIRTISAGFHMKKKECLKKKEEIVNDIRGLFVNSREKSYDNVPHSIDKSGKSKQFQTAFIFGNSDMSDHIRVECMDWSKKYEREKNWQDNLGVSVFTNEILNWFAAGYN